MRQPCATRACTVVSALLAVHKFQTSNVWLCLCWPCGGRCGTCGATPFTPRDKLAHRLTFPPVLLRMPHRAQFVPKQQHLARA